MIMEFINLARSQCDSIPENLHGDFQRILRGTETKRYAISLKLDYSGGYLLTNDKSSLLNMNMPVFWNNTGVEYTYYFLIFYTLSVDMIYTKSYDTRTSYGVPGKRAKVI
jgi:hypothetical protein